MRKPQFFSFLGIFAACALASPAYATYNATAIGTVQTVQQMSPAVGYTAETFIFNISNQPNVSGCVPWGGWFVISPGTVADAQTRKNFVALLLTAKSTGAQIQVAYDSNGGYCEQGFIGVYYISIL